jgi:hypothetical protein
MLILLTLQTTYVLGLAPAQKSVTATGSIRQSADPDGELPIYVGLSGYPTSTSEIDRILDVMDAYGLNIYRMSFNPEWFSRKKHPYRASYVQYFLDHSPYTLIVDRNHLYPPSDESAQAARTHWDTVRSSIFDVLETWPNNPRVIVELINEYCSSDFYPRMQTLIDDVRAAGYTNPLLANKWNQPWTALDDPLNSTYQGYHFYFNSWSLKGATDQMTTARAKGIKLINTEVGADYNEASSFTRDTVEELNEFMEWCAERDIGNCVWMNENLANWPRYQDLNLDPPTAS